MKHLLRLSFALAILLTIGAANSAADTITFNNSSLHPDGTFTIGNTVSLSNGVIDSVARILPTAGFNITGPCGQAPTATFGCLNLTTGAFVGPITSTTANDYAYMGTGSTITVTGGIAALALPNTTVLWTGSFDANNNVILQFDDDCISTPTQCTGSLTGTLALGSINPILAAALGVNPNSIGGNDQSLFVNFTGISLPVSGSPTGAGLGNTNQLQVVTPAITTSVPEPGSMFLLGSGLLMLARFVRRGR
jgi:PEP-CTERM motif-containing protein